MWFCQVQQPPKREKEIKTKTKEMLDFMILDSITWYCFFCSQVALNCKLVYCWRGMETEHYLSCASQAESLFLQGQFVSQLITFLLRAWGMLCVPWLVEMRRDFEWMFRFMHWNKQNKCSSSFTETNRTSLQVLLAESYILMFLVRPILLLLFFNLCSMQNFKITFNTAKSICFVLFQITVKQFPAHLVPSATNHIPLSDRVMYCMLRSLLLFLEMFA